MPKVFFVDDGPGKPEGANFFIGRRPIFAFGNSDGDKEMLEWIAAGDGSRFMGLVYHTDPAREYAYGPAGGLPGNLDHRRHEDDHDLPCGEGDSLRRKCPAHGRAPAQADRAIVSYFFVQLPNNANDEGASEIPPVNDPFSSEMVAFQVSFPCVP